MPLRRRPVVIANEIRLKRSQHPGAFLVVEGRDDRLFWERYIDGLRLPGDSSIDTGMEWA